MAVSSIFLIVTAALGFCVLLLLGMLLLSVVLRMTGGYAPGWQVRCTHCGHSRPAAEVGVIRVAAVGTKHTVGSCSQCGGLRRIAIERWHGSSKKSTRPAEF